MTKNNHPLMKYFGIISEEEGEAMLKTLKEIKAKNIKLTKAKLKREGFI